MWKRLNGEPVEEETVAEAAVKRIKQFRADIRHKKLLKVLYKQKLDCSVKDYWTTTAQYQYTVKFEDLPIEDVPADAFCT